VAESTEGRGWPRRFHLGRRAVEQEVGGGDIEVVAQARLQGRSIQGHAAVRAAPRELAQEVRGQQDGRGRRECEGGGPPSRAVGLARVDSDRFTGANLCHGENSPYS